LKDKPVAGTVQWRKGGSDVMFEDASTGFMIRRAKTASQDRINMDPQPEECAQAAIQKDEFATRRGGF